ncbi:MAG: 1,4-dihydroxy-2-naphthoate octaprenyltransferase [Fidelibacterota bacterium]
MNLKYWLTAFRLRTLPLAFSSIIMGGSLAWYDGYFNIIIFLLALITTLCLQILANLANDYGDFVHGADHSGRVGPGRMMQQGYITAAQMKVAIWVFIVISSIFGVTLIVFSIGDHYQAGIPIALLGLLSIGAAVAYTMGKRPYGYMGLGDIMVFCFFGLVGVVGSYFLYYLDLKGEIFLPAAAIGLLATGVLNINNIRDMAQDEQSGKFTLAVKLGATGARIYHLALILTSALLLSVYTWNYIDSAYRMLFFILYPTLILHAIRVYQTRDETRLDPYLKSLSLLTFFLTIIYWAGLAL